MQRLKKWLSNLSFRTGVIVLLCCIPCYILSFLQMTLAISFMGRFWRWHINFCPGWKAYFKSLDAEAQQVIREKYSFKKYK